MSHPRSPHNSTSTPPAPGHLEPGQTLDFDPTAPLLHYYPIHNPTGPALCGEWAPAQGWDTHHTTATSQGATVCPACQTLHATLPTIEGA